VPGEASIIVATERLAIWVKECLEVGALSIIECNFVPSCPVRQDVPYFILGERDDGTVMLLSSNVASEGASPGSILAKAVVVPQDDWEEFIVEGGEFMRIPSA